MTIELPGWRWWAGWAAAASAGVLAHRGDWWAAAGAGVIVVALVGARVREEMAAQRAALGEPLDPEPPHPAPRLRQGPRPPWDTATWPVLPDEADSGEVAGRHRAKRGLRDVVGDALRAVAQAYLS